MVGIPAILCVIFFKIVVTFPGIMLLYDKAIAYLQRPRHRRTSQQRARDIMGRNFFGVEEGIKHFSINPTPSQLESLAHEVPFSEEVLQSCRDTHVLVADFGLSIMEIRNLHKDLFYTPPWYSEKELEPPYHDTEFDFVRWYFTKPFAVDRERPSWRLVRKDIVPGSAGKVWAEQQGLISRDETTPGARIMVYAIIAHYLSRGERLFKYTYARCLDMTSLDRRVHVGYFVDGLCIAEFCYDGSLHNIGLAAVRK